MLKIASIEESHTLYESSCVVNNCAWKVILLLLFKSGDYLLIRRVIKNLKGQGLSLW